MPVPQPARRIYRFGRFCLDPAARLLLKDGQAIPLQPKVFDTLVLLVENAGNPVDKDTLLRALWPDTFVEEGNLAHNISALRKTLGEAPGGRPWIETLRKRGYQFVGQVTLGWPESPSADAAPAAAPQVIPKARTWRRMAGACALSGVVLLAALAGYLLLRRGAKTPLRNATFTQLTDQAGQELFPSLSPDGNYFVYASPASGNWDIYLQRLGGKNPINLTKDSAADDTQPALSPDGRQIAFRSERDGGGLFVMGATGESVRRVAGFGYFPAWSPDGRQIACSTQSVERPDSRRFTSRVFVVSLSTGLSRFLTQEGGDAVQPQWSPHGHRIAYWGVAGASSQRDIWTAPAAGGGNPVPVTNDVHLDWNPVWSPDGKYLYFSSDRAGAMNLWRVRMDEQSGKVLSRAEPVTTPSPYSGYICIARDATRMAYVQQVTTANLHKVAFDPAREATVGTPAPVTQGLREAVRPDLSPDGQWLAFNTWSNQEDIFVMRADGTSLNQLTNDLHKDRGACWSPSGDYLSFHSNRGGRWAIWVVRPDGSGLQQLAPSLGWNITGGVWSAEGGRIATSSDYGARPFFFELARRPGGSFSFGAPQPFLEQAGTPFVPTSWSARGEKLAGFTPRADGSATGIAIYFFETYRLERLTDFGSYPRWLSDGRRLLFNHRGDLLVMDSESRKWHRVLDVAPGEVESNFAVSRDDRTLYFSRAVSEADIWLMSLK